MNNEVNHDSYVSSNIAPIRTPNNGIGTTDNNNQTLTDKNDTQFNANSDSWDVNKRSDLRSSRRVRKPPPI